MGYTIIGTSHIAKQSVLEIKQLINEGKHQIVALELDLHRATALLQSERKKVSLTDIIQIGIKGYLFAKIGQAVQQKLGKMVGVAPGAEMKMALTLANKHQLQVAFIDQPIKVTLKNFSKNLSWKEKFRFIADVSTGIFFQKRRMKELGLDHFDLKTVPAEEVIEKMMGQVKQRYPNVYKTLVSDRNKFMVKQLIKLIRDNPGKNILVIVGAGHKKGMEELLLKVDVVRH